MLILWTGTCDLTSKVGQNRYGRKIIIDLNTVQVEDIVQQYNKFFEICSAYGDSVHDIILECLYYSISIWNSVQGHPYPNIFDQNELILYHKINELNQNIKELNSIYSVQAPDLIKTRKLKKSYPTKTVSYNLLKDGIHPGVTLLQYLI